MFNFYVIEYGKRGNSQRYYCNKCKKTFTRNYLKRINLKLILISYLDGTPLRKIARQVGKSPMTIFRICRKELLKLPICSSVTNSYCDMKKFGGFLVFDGKFLSVKGYKKDIPIIWGADYQTHDIPYFMLAPSESYVACRSFSWSLVDLYKTYGNDPRCLNWVEDLMIRRKELTNYHQFEGAPNTTNLIESYNSQLEQRTKAIKGFQSFKHARDWLNGFVLRRRFSKFTDCTKPFAHLNGKSPIENTKKDKLKLSNPI